MSGTRFQEIEHKFVVEDDFDRETFRRVLEGLEPGRTTRQSVRDIYYLPRQQDGYIFRHRYDPELQHLTVKSLEDDAEVRLEVNLDLGQHRGNQQETVEAFLTAVGFTWRGEILKEIEVFHFPDCEIVYYSATANGNAVACVEFEAVGQATLDDALATLERYEQRIGFTERKRTTKTLVELLFPTLPLGTRSRGVS